LINPNNRWQKIRNLFDQLVDLPPAAREQFLDKHCSDDEELRRELVQMVVIDHHASDVKKSTGPLTKAISAVVEANARERREALIGTVVGPYRLSAVLGHGGVGTVYLADRADQLYSAQVAIKIVESAAFNAEIGRRFRAERQILANLHHPGIARLLDSGHTENGLPYLVMEYVHGEPIHKYCDQLQLTIEQRIRLMLKVCDAVQYAHHNLVIHRDIKPANLWITPDGTPKLLDFGIAKLLDTGALASELALTRFSDVMLTPEYASPEQIQGKPVTTASDVYSLGVVLYELLSGLRPYKVSSSSHLELERSICIVEPSKPSAAVETQTQLSKSIDPPKRHIQSVVDARHTTPQKLTASLSGDLDAVILKALRKEPEHRYHSIEQLAADLRRYLDKEPVLARQGNWLYHTRRYLRRNAYAVAAGLTIFVLLATTTINYSLQSKRIAAERDLVTREKKTSDAVAEFMTNAFAATDPFTSPGKDYTGGELLDHSTKLLRSDEGLEPAVKARLLEALGKTYRRRGQYEVAISILRESVSEIEGLYGKDSSLLIPVLEELCIAFIRHSEYAESVTTAKRAIALMEQRGERQSLRYATVLGRLALATSRLSPNVSESFDMFERAIEIRRSLDKTNDEHYADDLATYALLLRWGDGFRKSEALLRESVAIYKAIKPKSHPDRMMAESLLGETLATNGKFDEAAPFINEALENASLYLEDNSPLVLTVYARATSYFLTRRDFLRAEEYGRKCVAIAEQNTGASTITTGHYREWLGIVLHKSERHEEAMAQFKAALIDFSRHIPGDHLFVASSEYWLAETLLAQGQVDKATRQFNIAIERFKRIKAAAWRIARAENSLGQALFVLGRYDEAQRLLESTFQSLYADQNRLDGEERPIARARLENFYVARGEHAKLAALRASFDKPKAAPKLTVSETSPPAHRGKQAASDLKVALQ